MTTPAPSQVTLWSPHARVGRISSTEDTSLGATYSDGGGMATSRRQIYNQDFARGPLCEDFKFFLSKLPKSLTHADIRKHFEVSLKVVSIQTRDWLYRLSAFACG